ncbi:MAG TPA: type II toxin-antitoxin system HicB family antitoxin [Verrucomicrobiota bacterium]|nr:type II toxin-antitoxin system HicB family antitoxin [Verrucomicrobiota bacterium]
MRYAIVIERGDTSYGAYVPDLPGCVAVGETRDEAVKLIHEAIESHVEMLREEGLPLPESRSTADYAEVALT